MTEDDKVHPVWTDAQLDGALTQMHAEHDTDLGNARNILGDAMMTEETRPTVNLPVRHRRRWLLPTVAAGAAVLVAGGLALSGSLGPATEGHGSRQAAGTGSAAGAPPMTLAGDELNRAARNREKGGEHTLKPGQYLYVDNIVSGVGQYGGDRDKLAWRTTEHTQTWVPADPSGVWVRHNQRVGRTEWILGTPEQVARHRDTAKNSGPPSGWFQSRCGDFLATYRGAPVKCDRPDFKEPSASFMAQLPRDPKALLHKLGGDTGNLDDEFDALQGSFRLLDIGFAPADLRAAIYKALALMPDIKITHRRANLHGRTGTAFGITFDNLRDEVIIDPDSGRYIGSRMVQVKNSPVGLKDGTVLDSSAFSIRVVDKARATK